VTGEAGFSMRAMWLPALAGRMREAPDIANGAGQFHVIPHDSIETVPLPQRSAELPFEIEPRVLLPTATCHSPLRGPAFGRHHEGQEVTKIAKRKQCGCFVPFVSSWIFVGAFGRRRRRGQRSQRDSERRGHGISFDF